MKRINRLEFQNLKSYGNKKQILHFDEEGGLILLSGKNGSGKSTIRDAIDLALFNKVPGKRKKFTPIKKLPNRHNKCLYCNINFINKNDNCVDIKRWITPNNIKVDINGIDETKSFKNFQQEDKDKLIGYNYETFKSFISMSMNDFKNFIVLEKSEKENLLNKLFNIEKIDKMKNYVKDFTKQIDKKLDLTGQKITIKLESKKEKENILNKITKSENSISIKELNKKGLELFEKRNELMKIEKTLLSEIKEMESVYNDNNLQKNRLESEINSLDFSIKDLENKISHYDSGECPFCETQLEKTGEKSKDLESRLNKLKKEKSEKSEILDEMKTELSFKWNKITETKNKNSKNKLQISELSNELTKIKIQKKSIKEKNEIVNVEQLENENEKLKEEIYELQKILKKNKTKKKVYLQLLQILEKSNTKSKIIKNALIPINNYIKDFLDRTNSNYKVKLDDNFDAIINEREEIDPELLSTGEDKKINIIIALSYLCFILDKNRINILFIDELFNSIDKDEIDLLLKLLLYISEKYNINIIIVHHYLDIMDLKYFKKIIKVEKKLFSDLKIIDNKK